MGILPQTFKPDTAQKIARTMSALKFLVVALSLVLCTNSVQGMGYGQRTGMHHQQKALPDIGGLFKKKVAAKVDFLGGLVQLKQALLQPLIGLKKKIVSPIIGIKKGLIGVKTKLIRPVFDIKKKKLQAVRGLIDTKINLLDGFSSGGGHQGGASYGGHHRQMGWN